MSYLITENRADATPENAPYLLRTLRYRGGQRQTVLVPCHVLRVLGTGHLRVRYWDQEGDPLIPETRGKVRFMTQYVEPSRVVKKESV